MPSRTFAFGQPESGDKVIVPVVEGEMAKGAGDSGGDRDSNDGDGDGTTSGNTVDST